MSDTSGPQAPQERRLRPGFRALIDEMMAQLRTVSQQELWTAEARAQAEADLERIMESVRREALRERGHLETPAESAAQPNGKAGASGG